MKLDETLVEQPLENDEDLLLPHGTDLENGSDVPLSVDSGQHEPFLRLELASLELSGRVQIVPPGFPAAAVGAALVGEVAWQRS